MDNKIKIRKRKQIIVWNIIIIFIFLLLSQSSSAQNDSCDLDLFSNALIHSKYSKFQQSMILGAIEELLGLGVNGQELNKVLSASITNHFDAYNIKKILEILIDAKKSGLFEIALINKVKEGLAKKVAERSMIQALLTEADNMKIAQGILKEHRLDKTEKEQMMIEELTDGLNNGIPQETLSEILSRSIKQGKEVEEIAEVSEELGNLSLRAYEMGFSEDEVMAVFQKALQSERQVEEICEDIQDMLIGAAAAKITMANGSNSSGLLPGQIGSSINDGSSGSTSTGTSETGISPSSSGSGISSAPTDSDDQPEVESQPDTNDSSSSPPEN